MNTAAIIKRNWFYAMLPMWALAAWGFKSTFPWDKQPRIGELIALFDWCVFLPITFAICYWNWSRRALILRLVALICGGIWIGSKIVPEGAQYLLVEAGGVRSAGLAIVLMFELAALATIIRVVLGGAPNAHLLEQKGVPPFVARLMIAEAKFWRWIWARITAK